MDDLNIHTAATQPTFRPDIRDAIDAHHAEYQGRPRSHLGASLLGRECERQLWYAFRWAKPERFPGRMLRLFNRGHAEEERFISDLRRVGCEVLTINPATGKQFNWSVLGGHVGGSQDGAARFVPGANPEEWWLLEFKTHSDSSFSKLVKVGVRVAKPEHVDQMILYMGWSGLRVALYCAVNKDNDELHFEEIRWTEREAARFAELMGKAERIAFADEPALKLSNDPAFWKCKQCGVRELCHAKAMPAVNCRTCAHVTPLRDGRDGDWHCALHDKVLSYGEQTVGCPNHVFNPGLMSNHGTLEDMDAQRNNITLRTKSGRLVKTGTRASDVLDSHELAGIADLDLVTPEWMDLRERMGARLLGIEPLEDNA